jgi:hypothetical protein
LPFTVLAALVPGPTSTQLVRVAESSKPRQRAGIDVIEAMLAQQGR